VGASGFSLVPPGALVSQEVHKSVREWHGREMDVLVPITNLLSSHYAVGVLDACPRLACLLAGRRSSWKVRGTLTQIGTDGAKHHQKRW